ncbi:MAG: hypothetical protein V4634_20415 [Pseudomonadota bacterium]
MKRNSRIFAQGRWMPGAIGVAILCFAPGIAAFAQGAHRSGGAHWHGDIARFHEHDWHIWRGGHWVHARHDGRFGWWWLAGGGWYFYPAPIYPYPSPWEPPPDAIIGPSVGAEPQAPATRYWYYCESSHTYYPYVPTCAEGWTQLPSTPGDAASAPSR